MVVYEPGIQVLHIELLFKNIREIPVDELHLYILIIYL